MVPGAGATPPITLGPEKPTRVLHDGLVGLQGGSPFIDLPLSGAVIECEGRAAKKSVGYALSVENRESSRPARVAEH